MSYVVEILADSVAPHGARITTFRLTYPRMIHAEFMTHRALSRNASSSRAIPTAKMLEWVETDPAMPIYWGKNQKGMQADQELLAEDAERAKWRWEDARDEAMDRCRDLMELGVHKQIASRILEPFAHINVVATATTGGWMNYFALRCHKDAMPEMRHLAVLMARAYRDSEPDRLEMGQWHLPFVTDEEKAGLVASGWEDMELVGKWASVSVARCARTSYRSHDGTPSTVVKDLGLWSQLATDGHWSPFEHQGRPHRDGAFAWSGNLRGWEQHRQMYDGQNRTAFDFATLEQFP